MVFLVNFGFGMITDPFLFWYYSFKFTYKIAGYFILRTEGLQVLTLVLLLYNISISWILLDRSCRQPAFLNSMGELLYLLLFTFRLSIKKERLSYCMTN